MFLAYGFYSVGLAMLYHLSNNSGQKNSLFLHIKHLLSLQIHKYLLIYLTDKIER